jgi:hypothetical protein
VLCGRGQATLGGAEGVTGPGVVAERGDRLRGGTRDRLGVLGGAKLCLELGVLAGPRCCRGDLVDLVPKQLDAPGKLVRIGEQLGPRRDGGSPGAIGVRYRDDEPRMTAGAIEQGELSSRLQEALLVVLAMDLTQPCAE